VNLSEEEKIQLIQGIAAGMLHLHKHNIVHRDLAARNILLTGSGDPKISVISLFVFFFSVYLIEYVKRTELTIDTNLFCWIDLLCLGFWNGTNSGEKRRKSEYLIQSSIP
jgi:serine/threonine protein kinase